MRVLAPQLAPELPPQLPPELAPELAPDALARRFVAPVGATVRLLLVALELRDAVARRTMGWTLQVRTKGQEPPRAPVWRPPAPKPERPRPSARDA